MDISAYAEEHLGDGTGAYLPDVGPAANDLTEIVQHEDHTQPLIANLFWISFTELPEYDELLAGAGLHRTSRPGPGGWPPWYERQTRQELLIRHSANNDFARYDLVVLDPDLESEPVVGHVRADAGLLRSVAASYWDQVGLELAFEGGRASSRLIGEVVGEVAERERFNVLIARPPEVVPTAFAPMPAWEVVPQPGEGARASVGITATDAAGRQGVTSADHAFDGSAVNVNVAGLAGVICSRHPVSDSCFIEVPDLSEPPARPARGPLAGLSPCEGENVSFHGVTSGEGATVVTGWDKGIPFEIQPWNRLRVLTAAITNPGDSGAALLNIDSDVVGFAFDRTGYASDIEYSAWIWAEFVYKAHGLR